FSFKYSFISTVIKCLPITAPEHGRIVMSGSYETDQEFSFGQAIRFECNEDYKLKGDREIYCSATGDWSQEVPQCIEITCTPPTILNGGVMVPRRLYKENERIQFNCDTGFKFNERSDAVCTEDGWRPAPLCIEVTCDPPKVADGSFVPSKTIYREEDVITVDCKHGFHFDSFSGNTAQCTKNGWIPVPKCVWVLLDGNIAKVRTVTMTMRTMMKMKETDIEEREDICFVDLFPSQVPILTKTMTQTKTQETRDGNSLNKPLIENME
ncbi:complement factor H-like, partial [Alligator sinensis]|uniref:Complement factor H-like n=1 Tax=Alligator sinensis TaxID=38654 RepID=A0A3Q0FZL9_ALLSI